MIGHPRRVRCAVGTGGLLRIVLAGGTGAAAAVAPIWLLFGLEPGLNDKWPAAFGAAAAGGALLLGSIVGGVLAHLGTDRDEARRAARRMLLFSFGTCILAFLFVTARLLDDLQ